MNEIKDQKRVIIADANEMRNIIRNYYEDLYSKKLANMGEIEELLISYNLLK